MLSATDLGVEVLSTGFHIGVTVVPVNDLVPENDVVIGVSGVLTTAFVCCVFGINKGFLNCIKLALEVNCNLVSSTFCSLVL